MIRWKWSSAAMAVSCLSLACCSAPALSEGKELTGEQKVDRYLSSAAPHAIARCMSAAGFTYVEVISSKAVNPLGMIGEINRNATGYRLADYANDLAAPTVDPNETIRARLSKPDQLAYDSVLYGKQEGIGTRRLDVNSCQGKAFVATSKRSQLVVAAVAKTRARFDVLETVVRYRAKWASCMQRKGFAFTSRNELALSLLNAHPDISELARQEKRAVHADFQCISIEEEKEIQQIARDFSNQVDLGFAEESQISG
jgi:hypothetical protein